MTWDSTAEYLTDKREADLLAAILSNLENDDDRQVRKADLILSDLIELGLSDAEKGPALFQFWQNAGPDYMPADELAERY